MSSSSGFREEVFNVFLAVLLGERGIVSVPESIQKIPSQKRRIPDVTVTEFWGLRVILEGRIHESPQAQQSLLLDAKKRIDEGLAPTCIAVLYPPDLRHVDWADIKKI